MVKYVLVTGGVVSGLGKGITASSVGVLLKAAGLRVTSIKIDPYLNRDAGTMSPYEHGEVYVLDDGGEADLDLGNYERFLDITLTKDHNITTGKIYDHVISRERRGDYLGKTVQVVPHITDAIQAWIEKVATVPVDSSSISPDVCIIELGGTVGDIESMVFLEALRQFHYRVGGDNFCHVHVSLVPVVNAVGEPKSKPTQHSVRELRASGLSPDLIVCRAQKALEVSIISKISLFCMVPSTHVLSVHDVPSLYHVPLLLMSQNATSIILSTLRLNRMPPLALPQWRALADAASGEGKKKEIIRIALVGKYNGLSDAYLSVLKAAQHAALFYGFKEEIVWVDSEKLQQPLSTEDETGHEETWAILKSADAVLIPGGFGQRGVEGKILAARYARMNNIPFLGICLGLQVAVIEYSRSVMGWKRAHSSEMDDRTEKPVVVFMPEISTSHMGGTMRLGSRCTKLKPGSLASNLYKGHSEIWERHRHRYEVNPDMVDELEAGGLSFSGRDTTGSRMECMELPVDIHPFYFAVQFHPEFQSRPLNPSPPFCGLVSAAAKKYDTSSTDSSKSEKSIEHLERSAQGSVKHAPRALTRPNGQIGIGSERT